MENSEKSDLIYDWNWEKGFKPAHAIELNDESLRDGLQAPYLNTPLIDDQIYLIEQADRLGIKTINIGLPGAGGEVYQNTFLLAQAMANRKLNIEANCAGRTTIKDIDPILKNSQLC